MAAPSSLISERFQSKNRMKGPVLQATSTGGGVGEAAQEAQAAVAQAAAVRGNFLQVAGRTAKVEGQGCQQQWLRSEAWRVPPPE
jgi:hypothetical protein